jgi:hypothetical protein
VFLHLAADALEWCGASRSEPLPLEGLRKRFLPEATFRGRQNAKLQYAVLAAAGVHGGTEPDLLDEVASWQTDDFMPGPGRALRPHGATAPTLSPPTNAPVERADPYRTPVLYAVAAAELAELAFSPGRSA